MTVPSEVERVAELQLRTCAECGHVCDRPDEFHPYHFCEWKKAGHSDPWGMFRNLMFLWTGELLPERPLTFRDRPGSRPQPKAKAPKKKVVGEGVDV